jgi:hypothetical protein
VHLGEELDAGVAPRKSLHSVAPVAEKKLKPGTRSKPAANDDIDPKEVVTEIVGDLQQGLAAMGQIGSKGGSEKGKAAPAEPKLVAIIERALFNYSDHVERVGAMRETFGKDSRVSLRFLDYGFPKFEELYRKWCTEEINCPLNNYATAQDEIKIPADKLTGKLWHMDSAMWALREAISSNSTEWVLVGQDMLFISNDNLWPYLATLDATKPIILGNRLKGYGGNDAATASGWGYLMSRAAAVAFSEGWDACSKEVEAVEYLANNGGNLDYGFGFCQAKVAEFVDTRDANGMDRFMLWPPSRIDNNDWWDSWYPDLRKDAPIKAVSPEVVSFFFAGAAEIRALSQFDEFRGPSDEFFAHTNANISDATVSMFSHQTWTTLNGLRTPPPAGT